MNFRNSRKRCTNQAENFTAADLQRSFRSFRKRYANYGEVDVPAQRQAASAVWLTRPRRVLDRAVFADSGSSAGHGDPRCGSAAHVSHIGQKVK
jgi:hypothetical protein